MLRYENGSFTRIKDYTNAPSALDGTSEVAAMFWDGERTALLDTYRGRIAWLNDDFTGADTLSVPNMAETAQNGNAHTAVLANGDIIMPTMIEDANYNEHHYLTRIVKRVVEVAEEDGPEDSVLKSFRDVQPGDPFYKEIVWMHQQGITTGWADGAFRPEASTQRAAMAAFIYRYTAWKNNS